MKVQEEESVEDVLMHPYYRPLIHLEEPGTDQVRKCVVIDHKHLDELVGRLMQICDLTGDSVQRTALKDTVKQITRGWLDTQFMDSGFDGYYQQRGGTRTVDVKIQDGKFL